MEVADKERRLLNEWLTNLHELEYDLDRGYSTIQDGVITPIKYLHADARTRLMKMEWMAIQAAEEIQRRREQDESFES